MAVTTFQGVVEDGQVKLPANLRLPERTKVYVVVPDVEIATGAYVGSPRLAHPEQASDFDKEVSEEPPDACV